MNSDVIIVLILWLLIGIMIIFSDEVEIDCEVNELGVCDVKPIRIIAGTKIYK